MKESDIKRFFNFLEGCASVYDKEIKEAQAKIFFNALAEYDFNAIEKSFNAHIRTSKFFPTPADIIQNIPKPKLACHIGADEAWQLALKAMDESNSVVLNEQIMKARECAMDVYWSGDKVGARMAFRDAYNRIILESPTPNWFVSLGFDKDGREKAKEEFRELKLLAGHAPLKIQNG
jgi:hypothetical protein